MTMFSNVIRTRGRSLLVACAAFAALAVAAAPLTVNAAQRQDDQKKDAQAGQAEVARLGEKAPDFTLTDTEGKEHRLSDYKGKFVIIEWFNPECPYVVHQHKEGTIKKVANKMDELEEVVWIAINSGAPGKQGTGKEKNEKYRQEWQIKYPVLLDEAGKVGRMYQAKVTPHMYVINPEGMLMYHGAIDNAPMGRILGDSAEVMNYVQLAVDDIKAGRTVANAETKPYGCSVKYGSNN